MIADPTPESPINEAVFVQVMGGRGDVNCFTSKVERFETSS
jgi:hypothetical protein